MTNECPYCKGEIPPKYTDYKSRTNLGWMAVAGALVLNFGIDGALLLLGDEYSNSNGSIKQATRDKVKQIIYEASIKVSEACKE